MKKFKKDLQAVTKEFKALTKKTKELTNKLSKTAVAELERAQLAIKLKFPSQHAIDALKVLTKQTEKLIKAIEKFEKEKAAKKTKAKPKGKKASARKRATGKKKATAKKKTAQPTATDQVLKIIKRSKKGIGIPTIKKKTGFDDKKVRNIVSRAYSQKKIKRVGKGVYVGA